MSDDANPPGAGNGDGMVASIRSCALCERDGVAWTHRLDPSRSRFQIYGREHTWAGDIATCDRCERLYQAGDDEGLATVCRRSRQGTAMADELDQIRNSLRAFRDADLGVIAMADWLPPGAADLFAEGFVPIGDLTGADHVARQWPETHRRAVPETRPAYDEDDGLCWLVRSPWPAIPVREVVSLMWQWVESQQPPRSGRVTPEDRRREETLIHQFLHRDQDWISKWLAGDS